MKGKFQKQFIVICVLFLLALTGLVFFSQQAFLEGIYIVKDSFSRQQRLVLKQTAVGIEKNLELIVQELEILSQSFAGGIGPEGAKSGLDAFFVHLEEYFVNDIGLIDAHGILQHAVATPSLIGTDFSSRNYFKKSMALAQAAPVYEFTTFQGTDSGRKGIVIAMPVFQNDRQFQGVIVAAIKINELLEGFFSPDDDQAQSEFWAVDSSINILMHPRLEPGPLAEVVKPITESFALFLNNATTGESYTGEYLSPAREITIGSAYSLKVAGESWTLITSTPEKNILKPLTPFSRKYISVISIIFLAIISATFIIFFLFKKYHDELMQEISERKLMQEELDRNQEKLEEMVRLRTSELNRTHQQLQNEVLQRKHAMEEAVVMEERGRLARELHDSVSQSLYSVTLFAETSRQLAAKGDEKKLQENLNELVGCAIGALKELRLLVYDLRPASLEEEGLEGALRKRLETVEQRSGVKGHLEVTGGGRLTVVEEGALYRMAQEALNNALKHSKANSVSVRIHVGQERVEMEVTDNGIGFLLEERAGKGGMGLSSMRERAEKLDGTMTVHTAPGCGTSIKIAIKRYPEKIYER